MKQIINLLSITALIASPITLGVVYLQSNQQQAVAKSAAAITKQNFPINQPQIINFELNDGFNKLTNRQQLDQLRDWLLLTAISGKGLNSENINQATYDLPIVRYNFMSPVANFEYGKTRSRYIGDGKIVAIVPKASTAEQRKDDLAHIADKHRKDQGEKPKTIEVFEYEITPNKQSAIVIRTEEVNAEKIFSSEYGYYETTIYSQNDIQNLINQIDDITFAQFNGSSITVGGRKVFSYKQPRISIEDIAALWQSDANNPRGSGFSLDPSFDYPGLRTSLDKAKPFLQSFLVDGKPIVSQEDIQKAEQGLIVNDIVPYRQLIDRFRKFVDSEAGIKALRIGQIGNEIRQELKPFIAQQNQEIEAEMKRYENQYRAEIKASIQSLQKSGYANEQIKSQIDPKIQQKQQRLTEIRQNIIKRKDQELALKHREVAKNKFAKIDNFIDSPLTQGFQSARYDGALQGTEVGMVLFYTDLLAKIWAINYLDSTPNQVIPDFNPLTKLKISSIYKEELDKLSSTRLWFGSQDKGFQVTSDGNNLLFARNATRIYAASSDPLNPGKETIASANSDAFLGWWNDHYEEVARHEPQYERLNQIMKWSLVINWLNQSNWGNSLNFLQKVSVKRDNWFPDWAKFQGKNLRFQQWQAVKFFGKGYKGTTTETMPILSSSPYKLFGKSRSMSGGVSLPNKNTFTTRLSVKSQRLNKPSLRSNIDYPSVSIKDKKLTFRTLDNIKYSLENVSNNVSKVTSQAGEKSRFRSLDAELTNLPVTRTVLPVSEGLKIKTSVGDTEFGNLNITKTANGFQVGFESRNIDTGYALTSKIKNYKGNDIPNFIASTDGVRAVRYSPSEPDNYFVQFSDSGNKWLQITGSGGGGKGNPPSRLLMAAGEPGDGARNFNIKSVDKAQVPGNAQGFQEYRRQKSDFSQDSNPRSDAQRLVENSAAFMLSKRAGLQQRIKNINTALKNGNYGKAEQLINKSMQEYGSEPQLMLQKALVEQHQGRLNIELVTPQGTKPIKQSFFDEINNRSFIRIETDTEFIYRQDSPGLNNQDFKQPIANSVSSGSGFRAYELKPGRVGAVPISQSGFGDVSASSHPATQFQGNNINNSLKVRHLNLIPNSKNECKSQQAEGENQNPNCVLEKPAYVVVEK
ncbi:MAG: hypothetical protein KME23_08920 [Goleter apudmare HA4340-LM2]|jgi:hypothetical protein|nr:hypothetical protein [Goleter apudmare HA4340-LM2]